MFVNCRMDKQNVAFVYDGKLFPHKKKLSADKFYNIDEH